VNIVLLPSPPFEEIGGVSTHVYMLAKGLRELGHDVAVVPENPPSCIRIPFIRLPEIIIGQANLYLSRRYRRWSEDAYYIADALWKTKGKIDVLNIQNVQHVGMAKVLRCLTGCRLALTVHGYLTYEAESRNWCIIGDKTHQWLWGMEKIGYDQVDSIICVGRRAASYITQFTAKTVTIIPNGLDTDIYKPSSEVASKKTNILFAGLLQTAKGILDALQVIHILNSRSEMRISLSVAGAGPQELAAKQYVLDNGLVDQVTFLGSLRKEKMPYFYRQGDILLFPSRQAGLSGKSEESSPYSVLEAMSSGLPIVAYRTSALEEHVQDGITGYLVAPDDVGALADRVHALMADTNLLKRMGAAARIHCVEKFSHIIMAQQYLKVYAEGATKDGSH